MRPCVCVPSFDIERSITSKYIFTPFTSDPKLENWNMVREAGKILQNEIFKENNWFVWICSMPVAGNHTHGPIIKSWISFRVDVFSSSRNSFQWGFINALRVVCVCVCVWRVRVSATVCVCMLSITSYFMNDSVDSAAAHFPTSAQFHIWWWLLLLLLLLRRAKL